MRKPFAETMRGKVFAELTTFAVDNKTVPHPHAFYMIVIRPKYRISRSRFRNLWMQLAAERRIVQEVRTGCWSIAGSELTIEEIEQAPLWAEKEYW